MKDEYLPAAGRQFRDSMLEGQAVDNAVQGQIRRAEVPWRPLRFFTIIAAFETDLLYAFFAKAHQNHIHRDAMQPGGEGGVAPEQVNLSKQTQECFLSQLLSLRRIPDHAKAQVIDASFMSVIESFER
ncbi:MAG TPA: hypothetical protein VGH17_06050 [Candidatus Acidoferrales bacterium]